ncbi:MAG: hypothetical protein ACRDDH_14480 [Cetobacterium sp.]|uniref:hypothetical protein n=1 Tax=Cetobacterium sp. TaxID=2071632 RepID=UPI003EE4FBF3
MSTSWIIIAVYALISIVSNSAMINGDTDKAIIEDKGRVMNVKFKQSHINIDLRKSDLKEALDRKKVVNGRFLGESTSFDSSMHNNMIRLDAYDYDTIILFSPEETEKLMQRKL